MQSNKASNWHNYYSTIVDIFSVLSELQKNTTLLNWVLRTDLIKFLYILSQSDAFLVSQIHTKIELIKMFRKNMFSLFLN